MLSRLLAPAAGVHATRPAGLRLAAAAVSSSAASSRGLHHVPSAVSGDWSETAAEQIFAKGDPAGVKFYLFNFVDLFGVPRSKVPHKPKNKKPNNNNKITKKHLKAPLPQNGFVLPDGAGVRNPGCRCWRGRLRRLAPDWPRPSPAALLDLHC